MTTSIPERRPDPWKGLEREFRRRDLVLTQLYVAGLSVGAVCVLLPFQLSRIGGVLVVVSLLHMAARVVGAHGGAGWRPGEGEEGEPCLERLGARLALTGSALFNLPFVVGANLVIMGLPLSSDAVVKAVIDCVFLGLTVVLFGLSYWLNQRAILRNLSGGAGFDDKGRPAAAMGSIVAPHGC